MAGKLSPVGRYETAEAADAAQDSLSQLGIQSALVDENLLRRDWEPGMPTARLLLVDPDDAGLAEKTLDHAGLRGLPLPNADDTPEEIAPPRQCPACGSTDIRR